MKEVLLEIVEKQSPPNGEWTAELWSGFPGTPGVQRLAGGTGSFTQVQLEAPLANGTRMDRDAVLNRVRNQDGPDPAFMATGLRFYELLDQTQTAAKWLELRDTEEQAGRGLRTYLKLPAYFEEWPWELLCFPVDTNTGRRAFNRLQHPILRVAQKTAAVAPLVESTVRILLVSGQEFLELPNKDDSTRASKELRLIRQIFQGANLSVVVDLCEAPPDADTLQNRIAAVAPHILHFVAHGDIPAGADFKLEFLRTTLWKWSANEILQFFDYLPKKPRLVVLNSCNAARREAHAAPITKVILEAGVPAVIGPLAALQIDYARDFSKALYGALAQGESVDRAVVKARMKIVNLPAYGGIDRRHWALPVLTVRSPVDELIKFKRASSALKECEVAKLVFRRPGSFVNRASDRWSLLSAFPPPNGSSFGFRGVILSGQTPQVGKTWLALRTVRDFLDSDFIVRYAQLVGVEASRTSLDVLEDWRGRAAFNSPILGRVAGPHFDDFDQALEAARSPGGRTAAAIETVFRTFKAGLQSYRNGKNVLLVLGRFRQQGRSCVPSRDFGEYLLEKLLLPIQAIDKPDPETEGLYCLLIVRQHYDLQTGQPADFDEFQLSRLSADVPNEANRLPADGFRRVTLREFSAEEIDRHFDEFSEFSASELIDALRLVTHSMVGKKQTWSPKVLQDLDGLVQTALSSAPQQG